MSSLGSGTETFKTNCHCRWFVYVRRHPSVKDTTYKKDSMIYSKAYPNPQLGREKTQMVKNEGKASLIWFFMERNLQ